MMLFREWLLLSENMTVAQFLKQPANVPYVASVKNTVVAFLSRRLHGVNQNAFSRYVNWFVAELIRDSVPEQDAGAIMGEIWSKLGDYIVAHLTDALLLGKLNAADYTSKNMWADRYEWMQRKGNEGRSIVPLDDLPGFKGWKWVALDRPSCSQEGKVMGHCGNMATPHRYDNLLSLRDPRDIPHLTFINNHGVLGEMKGRNNDKPAAKYHPAIVRLLLSNEVGAIRGGGYEPLYNFALTDLDPKTQEYVKARKPYIDNPDLFERKRESIVRGVSKKARGTALQGSNALTIGSVVPDVLHWRIDGERMYDMGTLEMPDRVRSHHLWKFYNELLDATYIKSRRENSAVLFEWMDHAINSFVKELADQDERNYENLVRTGHTHFFVHQSNIAKLYEMVDRLMENQPEVMVDAPKRYTFGSFEQYKMALTRYLDRLGYDLPPWRPENHMISYEFNVAIARSILTLGRAVFEKVAASERAQDELYKGRLGGNRFTVTQDDINRAREGGYQGGIRPGIYEV